MSEAQEAVATSEGGGTKAFPAVIAGLVRQFEMAGDAGGRASLRIGTGVAARLRRMDPQAPETVFWSVLADAVPPELKTTTLAEAGWMIVLNGMATMSPDPHVGGIQLGRILAETGYSEMRLTRLLRAGSREDLAREIGVACRWLRAKGRAVDWIGLAAFVFTQLGVRLPGMRQVGPDAVARGYFDTIAMLAKPAKR